MKTKEKYLEKKEIRVKNLLSELYESESEIQKEMMTTKERYNQKMAELEREYKETLTTRKELQSKFEHLKSVNDDQWENTEKDFELLLEYVEGDKETFIEKAEALIKELGEKIQKLEDEAASAAAGLKSELTNKANDLKISKHELQEKIDAIKSDTSDRWREIKHWFFEKTKSVKEFIS